MAFGGIPSGALVPANLITNIKGEPGVSYDANDRIAFQSASGTVYTPERVDTLFIIIDDQENDALGALVAGSSNIANADSGMLTTLVPAANQSGLPSNFGPGRGRWGDPTGQQRIRSEASEQITVVDPTLGIGSVVLASVSVPSGPTTVDAVVIARNFHGEALGTLRLMVECVHSVQG